MFKVRLLFCSVIFIAQKQRKMVIIFTRTNISYLIIKNKEADQKSKP